MTGDKLLFRFEKAGDLRLLSHHDLMRSLERLARRAELPVKQTAGFHPGPRIVFALSLPLGVDGRDEVVEIELTRPHDSDAVLATLNAHAPPGLRFTRCSVVPMKATAVPRRVVYRLPLPADRAADTAAACERLMADDEVWVERLKPNPRRLDVRPFLRRLAVAAEPNPPAPFPKREGGASGGEAPVVEQASCLVSAFSRRDACSTGEPLPPACSPPRPGEGPGEGFFGHTLVLDLWVTQTGTARADELVHLLGVRDVWDAGGVLERSALELHDEAAPPADPADVPPAGPARTRPLDRTPVPAAATTDAHPAAAHWGASPNGPVVE